MKAVLCGRYVGDNDGTCPQLTCIRLAGHDGFCDNIRGDLLPWPLESIGSTTHRAQDLCHRSVAYLVGRIDKATKQLIDVDIFSEASPTFTEWSRYHLVVLLEVADSSYAAAKKLLLDAVMSTPSYEWLRPILCSQRPDLSGTMVVGTKSGE